MKYNQAAWWIWGFVRASITGFVIAPVLYLYVPTEYSSVVGFNGSVAQAFTVSDAMFVMDRAKVKSS